MGRLDRPQSPDNGPTPWVGMVERVSVFSYLLWVAVLAIALLPRRRAENALRTAPDAMLTS